MDSPDREAISLKTDRPIRIIVNNHPQNEFPNIYSAGDVIDSPTLAHCSYFN
jgi:pyruvate/2-oxoglutarate dehydrogenase complex dihydrolipoamide dehydrogenase (E3) component